MSNNYLSSSEFVESFERLFQNVKEEYKFLSREKRYIWLGDGGTNIEAIEENKTNVFKYTSENFNFSLSLKPDLDRVDRLRLSVRKNNGNIIDFIIDAVATIATIMRDPSATRLDQEKVNEIIRQLDTRKKERPENNMGDSLYVDKISYQITSRSDLFDISIKDYNRD